MYTPVKVSTPSSIALIRLIFETSTYASRVIAYESVFTIAIVTVPGRSTASLAYLCPCKIILRNRIVRYVHTHYDTFKLQDVCLRAFSSTGYSISKALLSRRDLWAVSLFSKVYILPYRMFLMYVSRAASLNINCS
jgi:hypothetical protein